ncbi:MAG: glycosyltransferase family 39 protein [Burkholderiales bacterium]|nr:glycosyltransferase family 39 protein [Burkholderiales bacterium]MDE1929374.1 glycosyltransferase family 39 protein [Burkholderiales bacterium]MDE2159375.1 glycosyltransferase family 39 protein [Burkholderiales bacterium]MDE2503427.1 glycosyltransferase family 39 protein [Burkholderiales bacterium]
MPAIPDPSRATPSAPDACAPTRRWVWALLALAVAAAWIWALDARHLLRSDEGRYAEIAREMTTSGDWVTVRYLGLKYFEKPPLQMWMTALAFEAFGVGDWQARLWVGSSGALAIALTAWAGARGWGRRAGLATALALLAAPTWNLASHFNSLDMGVSAALAAVLAALLLAQRPDADAAVRRRWMLAAWAAMAAAVLTKGLIGIVLPGLALVVYTLATRAWALWGRLHIVVGTLLFALIAVPWFVVVAHRNPAFAWFFFVHEHWQRYTTTVHQRGEPIWYFLPQLLLGFLPWIGLTPAMLTALRREDRRGFRPLLFCACWAASIFVFFSLSDSKLPGYILPVFPALALIAGVALTAMDARRWRRQIVAMALVAAVALAASPLVARVGSAAEASQFARFALWIAAAAAILLGALALAWWLNRRGRLRASIAAYALGFFAAITVGMVGHETLGRAISGVDLVPPIEAVLRPGMPFYSVRLLDHTLPFYLHRTMILVEQPDELAFGVAQEPQKWLPTLAGFEQAWRDGPPALALMTHATYAQLQAARLPMSVVAQDERRVVVANFEPHR